MRAGASQQEKAADKRLSIPITVRYNNHHVFYAKKKAELTHFLIKFQSIGGRYSYI